jgi:predicted acyltransferase
VSTHQASRRLVSLDVFRGATVAAMILVNNPGSWGHIYGPLRHADWHGWTITDLIFPFFLFIVGVAIVLAFSKRLAAGADKTDLQKKTWVRAAKIMGLGLLLSAFPYISFMDGFGLHQNLTEVRVFGVLQRIAICYLAASLMFIYLSERAQYIWIAAILLGYWAVMTLIPVPGYGAGQIDSMEGNLAAWLDRQILGEKHLWRGTFDPEGILSTFPAIATTMLGVFTGRILVADTDQVTKTVRFFIWGCVFVIIGYVWDWFFPINKPIWTSSYVLFTAGQAMCAFALCYWVIDVKNKRGWTTPFVAYGINALIVFFMSGILARSLNLIRVPGPDETIITLQRWIFNNVFLPVAEPINASLMYAIVWIVLWFFVLYWMMKRDIIIKV